MMRNEPKDAADGRSTSIGGTSQLLLLGGILLGIVLFTVAVIHNYDRPGIMGKRQSKILSAPPQILRQLLNQSEHLFREKRYPEAERSLKRILNLDRDNLVAMRMLGNVYYLSGRYYDAGNMFRSILARHPKDAVARNNLGLAMVNMQWYEAGIRELLAARALDPGQPGIDLNLSRAYEALGDTEKAAYHRALAERHAEKLRQAEKPEAEPPEPHHE